MTHKEKCKKMKSIRKTIADRLGVDLHQKECTYKGECSGTCPKCEQEEKTLNRALLKNSVAVAGLAMSAISITGCGSIADRTTESSLPGANPSNNPVTEEVMGVIAPTTEYTSEQLDGEMIIEGLETDPSCTVTLTTETELTGDEPYPLEGGLPCIPYTEESTTEDFYELDGDIAIAIPEDYLEENEVISSCLLYSGADIAEITLQTEDYPSSSCTVECSMVKTDENGEKSASVICTISVQRMSGYATDDKGNSFNLRDYLIYN